MRARGLRCAVLLCATGTAHAADPAPQAAQDARMFLLRYAGLTATSDVAALDLYRDDARIQVSTWQGGREIQRGIAPGRAWKAQLRAGWFDGTSRLEASSFHDAFVTPQGQRLVIQARRYSQARCYWDSGYAVVIEPDGRGQHRIVEERLTFLPEAACPATAAAAAILEAPAMHAPLPTAAGAAVAAPAALLRPGGLPPNVVPSGRGLPRLPAPSGSAPGSVPLAGAAGVAVR